MNETMADLYRSAFTKNQLFANATLQLVAGVYNLIGFYTVLAGENISMGVGSQNGQENAIGRLFAQFMDNTGAGVEIKGTARFSVWSPQNRVLTVLYEFRTETMNTVANDRTKQIPLPENMIALTKDKKLVLEFLPDTALILSKVNSTLVFDITQGVA